MISSFFFWIEGILKLHRALEMHASNIVERAYQVEVYFTNVNWSLYPLLWCSYDYQSIPQLL